MSAETHDTSREVSEFVKTFTLESVSGESIPHVKAFYSELHTLGKHYLVRSTENMNKFRHYTICNVMAPKIYDEFVRCLKSGSGLDFDIPLLETSAEISNSIRLTVKNYQTAKGVSSQFFIKD